MPDTKEIEDLLTQMNLETAETTAKKGNKLGVYDLMDDWFQPKSELMKHVIIIQMIACFIVSCFLLVTSGDNMSSEALLIAIMLFMLFVAGMFGFYNRMVYR
mgnify:FL=1|tara:strand:- start:5894 stop:6199 length:306 start_codon:yes stop_codon:yes gene_type:complete